MIAYTIANSFLVNVHQLQSNPKIFNIVSRVFQYTHGIALFWILDIWQFICNFP